MWVSTMFFWEELCNSFFLERNRALQLAQASHVTSYGYDIGFIVINHQFVIQMVA